MSLAIRALSPADWPDVLRIYAEGITTGHATFETEPTPPEQLDAKWVPGHRWVAAINGQLAGWASASPTSQRPTYAGVLESSIYVGDGFRDQGVGRALIKHQVTAADNDPAVWTLQTSIFPENEASVALHEWAGFRVVGRRERIGKHHGRWRDTLILERRSPTPA